MSPDHRDAACRHKLLFQLNPLGHRGRTSVICMAEVCRISQAKPRPHSVKLTGRPQSPASVCSICFGLSPVTPLPLADGLFNFPAAVLMRNVAQPPKQVTQKNGKQ